MKCLVKLTLDCTPAMQSDNYTNEKDSENDAELEKVNTELKTDGPSPEKRNFIVFVNYLMTLFSVCYIYVTCNVKVY